MYLINDSYIEFVGGRESSNHGNKSVRESVRFHVGTKDALYLQRKLIEQYRERRRVSLQRTNDFGIQITIEVL